MGVPPVGAPNPVAELLCFRMLVFSDFLLAAAFLPGLEDLELRIDDNLEDLFFDFAFDGAGVESSKWSRSVRVMVERGARVVWCGGAQWVEGGDQTHDSGRGVSKG